MNHGGRRRTMAAMVPHPWLRGTETSANMSYNKAASLKLELIIFNRNTTIRVRAGTKNSRPVGFLR